MRMRLRKIPIAFSTPPCALHGVMPRGNPGLEEKSAASLATGLSPAPGALRRSLGPVDAAALIIGCTIGVGIFRTAASVAAHIQTAGLVMLAWAIGGLLSFCGALCYAELGAAYPTAGGDYVYLTRAYGRVAGFLFGWTKIFIERIGTIAIMGVVFGEYLGAFTGYGPVGVKIAASGSIVALTAANSVGLHVGKRVQNLLAALKILALLSIIGVGLSGGQADLSRVQPLWPAALDPGILPAFGMALVFVIWTYGGWSEAAFVAEEIRDPHRALPWALFWGLALITGLYLLVNWVYLLYIPLEQMPGRPMVAAEVMRAVLGPAGGTIIAGVIACSALGALNGMILTGGRILLAMGRDHALFDRLARIHPSSATPVPALAFNSVGAFLLVWAGTFEQIVTYSTVVIGVFYAMSALAVILLRRKDLETPRPYRVWGYPVTPLLFVLASALFIGNVTLMQPRETLLGFFLLACGLPLYAWSQRLAARRSMP